jgi:transcriptional regulator with XRE-family HTH domain
MSDRRGYSASLVKEVAAADPALPSVRLAKLCIAHGLSVWEVSAKLGVCRMTIYKWFCGRVRPRPRHLERIVKLTEELERA